MINAKKKLIDKLKKQNAVANGVIRHPIIISSLACSLPDIINANIICPKKKIMGIKYRSISKAIFIKI